MRFLLCFRVLGSGDSVLGEVYTDKAIDWNAPGTLPGHCSPGARPPHSVFRDQDEWPGWRTITAIPFKS